jgi:mannan endo-1,4-beta-mannosidase
VAGAGGVVTCSASLANPQTRHSVKSRRLDWDALLHDDGDARERWEQSKVNLGNMLQRFEDDDVIVLWRPFHESTGDWFWWSTATPAEYEALWRELYDYLVEERQLDNLLWVYAPAATTSDLIRDPLFYWPGDDRVDIVGVSFYGEDPENLEEYGLRELRTTGKPVAATELGPAFWVGDEAFDARKFKVLPELGLSYALFWSSWGNNHMSLGDLRHGDALIAEPDLWTLSDWRAPVDAGRVEP